MKRRFVLNAVIMTGSALLTHTMAAGFRVYMSNTIGSSGIGLYQLICTIYFFCVTFSTSGITLITTRTVTECFAKGDKGRGRRFTILGLYTALGLSAVSSVQCRFCRMAVRMSPLSHSITCPFPSIDKIGTSDPS